MADDAQALDPATEQDFKDLVGFLQDQKAEVRRFAAEGVLSQTASEDFLRYCQQNPRSVARSLLRLAERASADSQGHAEPGSSQRRDKESQLAALEAASAQEAGAAALQALVNLSAMPAFLAEMVDLSAPRRCAEALRAGWLEGRAGFAHWHAMLLANVTTSKAGQEALCTDEALLRFLFAAYVANPRPPPRDGYDDPLMWLGKAIGNVCVLPQGRQILAHGEQGSGVLTALVGQLGDRVRRLDALSALRNICLDAECHAAVATTGLLASMASFLYPWDSAGERRELLPESLQARLSGEGAAMTGDAAVRSAAAACLLGLCGSDAGVELLRAGGGAEVVQAWREQETEEVTLGTLEAVLARLTA